jgi:hypothetical protein
MFRAITINSEKKKGDGLAASSKVCSVVRNTCEPVAVLLGSGCYVTFECCISIYDVQLHTFWNSWHGPTVISDRVHVY